MKKKYWLVPAAAALVLLVAWFAWVRSRPAEAGPAAKNLLLVTLDTTRADRLGCYGDRAARTPVLDGLAREGVLFENCYAPAPLTLPAHSSLFTGRWPFAHGVRNNSSYRLAAGETTLAEKLSPQGYDAAALIAAYVLKSKFGLAQGFSRYDDDLGFEERAGNIDAQVDAERMYVKFRSWLAGKRDKPFFLWIHFYDPHKPYAPPAAYLKAAAGDAYRGEVAYVDHILGRLLADLKERRLLADTLVVVAGDHGEAFGEHGEKGHGVFCYEESLKVPLIFHNPTLLAKPARVSRRVSLVDVMPTVLDILSMGVAEGSQGQSLVPLMRGRGVKAPRALYLESMYGREMNNWAPLSGLISGSYKYISLPQAELYDLQADPGEKTNLFFKKNILARSLDRELARFVGRHRPGGSESRLDLQAEDRSQLAALGYISSFASAGQAGMDPKTGMKYQFRYEELVAALDRGEVDRVEAEALRLRAETTPLKLSFAYIVLHYVYERRRQWDKLEANLLRACEVFKESPTQALTFRGNLLEFYFANQDLALAERLALEMNGIYPDKTRVMEILGEINEKRRDWRGAWRWYDQAARIEAGNSALAKKALRALMEGKYTREALAASEALLKTESGARDTDLLFAAAMLFIEAGNGTRAEELLRRLTEIQPTGPRWFDYALVLGRNGKLAEAIAAMEKALAISPGELDGERLQAASKALALWRARRGK